MNINSTITAAQFRAAWKPARPSASESSSFSAQLNAAVTPSYRLPDGRWTDGNDTYSGSEFYSVATPSMQLQQDYEKWAAGRPPLSLPEDGGLTETNLAYLRERYPGAMTEFERMEVLQALKDTGTISREEYNGAMGLKVYSAKLDSTYNGKSEGYIGGVSGVTYGPLEEGFQTGQWYQKWADIHVNSPFAGFGNLEDILSWLKALCPEGIKAGIPDALAD